MTLEQSNPLIYKGEREGLAMDFFPALQTAVKRDTDDFLVNSVPSPYSCQGAQTLSHFLVLGEQEYGLTADHS